MNRLSSDQASFVFSPAIAPALTVNSGDVVVFETRDAFMGQIASEDDSPADLDFSAVNAATGPLFVRGARPGMALKVEILEIALDEVGYQCIVPGFGVLKERFTEPVTRKCLVRDGRVSVGTREFAAAPNIGTIGVSPGSGELPTIRPGDHGGNLDCKEIGAGTTLYLPVFVEGGLLGMGDVHAVQGDGEVCGVAVEIGALVTVRTSAVNWRIKRPVLVTDDTIIALASADSLDEAAVKATGDMVDILSDAGLDPLDAYTYMTLAGDLGIAQAVNPCKTAKVVVPRPSGFSPGR